MKKKWLVFILMAGWLASGARAAASGDELFEKAKTLLFDKQWAAALKNLDEIIARHADGRYYPLALFYRGKCQGELGDRSAALASYEKFVALAPGSNLAEEALISSIDLAAALYKNGAKDHLKKVVALLGHGNRVVSYYAAFKLSYVADRAIAALALPLLQDILDREKDEELRDRAKIAVMRIDPSRLKGAERGKGSTAGRALRIRVDEKGKPGEQFTMSIPLALADLALKSLGAEQKQILRKKGYDPEGILDQLLEKGMKIDIRDGESVIQIWIE